MAEAILQDMHKVGAGLLELAKFAQAPSETGADGVIRGQIEPMGIFGYMFTAAGDEQVARLRENRELIAVLDPLAQTFEDLAVGHGESKYQAPVDGLCMRGQCREIAEALRRLLNHAAA